MSRSEVGESQITALHKAAAFGWPQQASGRPEGSAWEAQFLLARAPEVVFARTSAQRSAREVADEAVAWCLARERSPSQHRAVAELCARAERGERIDFDVVGAN